MNEDFNKIIPKSLDDDLPGRFREIIMDPLNLFIDRVHNAGFIDNNYVILHNGISVPYFGDYAYYNDFSKILIYNRGVHEPLEEFIFQELLKKLPDSVSMIEMGAYWGHYSMWLKRNKINSNLILIEENEHNLKVGKSNIERLGISAEFIHQRVGHKNFSIDEFFKERSINCLNILHADIQGYELEMILDSSKSLSSYSIDYLMISTHSQTLHYSIINHLMKHNYDIEVTSDFDNETTSHDGFIFSSSPNVSKIVKNWKPLGRLEIINSNNKEIFDYVKLTKERFNL